VYNTGNVKQADATYFPQNLPSPNRQNQLKYQPNTTKHFPSVVFECAVTHENMERLLNDAHEKHFHINSSVAVWIGLKIRLRANNGHDFWMGWGDRGRLGYGLDLREQTESPTGEATFVSVNAPNGKPLATEFNIPSSLVFHGVIPPPNAPTHLKIVLEEVRLSIIQGLSM
jgi:hypothetical protein